MQRIEIYGVSVLVCLQRRDPVITTENSVSLRDISARWLCLRTFVPKSSGNPPIAFPLAKSYPEVRNGKCETEIKERRHDVFGSLLGVNVLEC
jgi:hypothetical protein